MPETSTMGLNRPVPVYDPSRGLLHNEHFQLGYVTNDVDRAVQVFRDRFGVAEFRSNDNELPGGTRVGIRSVWIGNMMYEICYGSGAGMELYTDWAAPEAPFVLRFHHFGYLVPDEQAWQALEAEIERKQWLVRTRTDTPDFCKVCYVEVPELGHFLEFILARKGLFDRMNTTPVA